MKRYSQDDIHNVQHLRSKGLTYSEIKQRLNLQIPKATMSYWCKGIVLPSEYDSRVAKLTLDNLTQARSLALETNKMKRKQYLANIQERNLPISQNVADSNTAKIALAMLCLGEAAKYPHPFSLGNSDPRIIRLFLYLLKKCFDFDIAKVRCTVQCRADQDIQELEQYWVTVTNIPIAQFYKARIDPRTEGRPTKNTGYKGVLRVNYLDSNVQLELESIANLVYNHVITGP